MYLSTHLGVFSISKNLRNNVTFSITLLY